MYMIIRSYADCSTMTELTDDLCNALRACSIYWADPDCCYLKIIDTVTNRIVFDVYR